MRSPNAIANAPAEGRMSIAEIGVLGDYLTDKRRRRGH